MSASWYRDAFDDLYLRIYAHRDQGEARRVVRWLATRVLLEGARVLDIGAGGGRHLSSLATQEARAVGLDLSRALLASAARERGPATGFELVRGDMRRLPFGPGVFDGGVSMFTSLGYFEGEENTRVLSEVGRVVRPGGFFLVDYLNAPRVERRLVAASERRVGPYRILERRRIERPIPRVLKEIQVVEADSGVTTRVYHEAVALWDRATLTGLLDRAGFTLERTAGDYDGQPYEEQDSPRLLLLTRHRPHPEARGDR